MIIDSNFQILSFATQSMVCVVLRFHIIRMKSAVILMKLGNCLPIFVKIMVFSGAV